MIVADLKHLNPKDVVLWLHVEAAVWRLVKAARAPVVSIQPTPTKMIDHGNTSLYGQCQFFRHPRPGVCRLLFTLRRVQDGAWHQQRMPLHHLLDTIAHEVAHAKVGWDADHDAKFFRAFGQMILLSEKLKLRLDIQKADAKLPK